MQFQLSLPIQQPWQALQRWVPRRIAQAKQLDHQSALHGLAVRTGIKAGQSESTYTVTYSSPSPRVIED